jgi:hypothetical protein
MVTGVVASSFVYNIEVTVSLDERGWGHNIWPACAQQVRLPRFDRC